MTTFIAASGISVDLGRQVVLNTQLQTLADSSAMNAALYINLPMASPSTSKTAGESLTAQALDSVAENGGGNDTVSVIEGDWSTSAGWTAVTPPGTPIHCEPTIPPTAGACNAVMVTVSSVLKNLFSHGSATHSRTAIAAILAEAAISMGTYLFNFSAAQVPALNTLLGSLGTTVNFSAAGYDGLANTSVSIQQLINASGGVLTPTNVLTTSLPSQLWATYLSNAASAQVALLSCAGSSPPYQCAGHTALATLVNTLPLSGGPSATLCQLVSVASTSGTTSCTNSKLSQVALSASVNVLQTLTTDAELAALSGHSAINVTSALGLANVASASLSFTAIQPPQVAYGPVGTTVNTGQVQLTLTLTLTSGAVITIGPITGGNGTASITSITCANTNTEYLTKMTASTTAASAAVTAVGLGATTLTINGVSGVSVTFGTNVVPPNVNSVQLRTNPIYVTLSSPTFSYSGAALTGTTGTVLTALGTALPPVLQALGMTVANAQMAELSASCTDVALVR